MSKNQHSQRKSLNFENWSSNKLSKSANIWLSKSIFYVKNHPKLCDFFFIEEYEFRNTFLNHFIFLKWCPIFDSSPLLQFSKFNDFLCECWFLAKNLSNFVPLPWKRYNRYCHRWKYSWGKSTDLSNFSLDKIVFNYVSTYVRVLSWLEKC